MRNYSIFTPQRWIGNTGKKLRRGIITRVPGDPEREAYKDAQIIADLLLNNPNANQFGLYYVTVAAMSDLTGLLATEIAGALTLLEREEFAFYDESTEFVWVKEMARVQMYLPLKPGDRQVTSTNAWYRQVPRNPFLGPFFDRYGEDLRLTAKRDEWAPRSPRLPLLEPSAIVGTRVAEASPAAPLFQQWFLIFLEAYPASRRVGGAAGEAAFQKAMRGRGQDHLNVMLDALWFQRKSDQWKRGVVPSMTKWLEEEQWVRDMPADKTHDRRGGFECPDAHEDCRSPGQHALRVALDAVCKHAFRCTSFLEHYNKEALDGVESEEATSV